MKKRDSKMKKTITTTKSSAFHYKLSLQKNERTKKEEKYQVKRKQYR